MKKTKPKLRSLRLLGATILLFALINIIAAFHAYKFTHFSNCISSKTPEELSLAGKLQVLFLGISNPKPVNSNHPSQKFETIKLQSNKQLECWHIAAPNAKGTVILFHGYGGEKSSMLDKSDEFLKLGYNTLLVDFMGSGNSEGNQTTVGFKEAEEVKTAFDYLAQKGERHIFLFGTSMGAVAIMKAMKDYSIKPEGIILECPFGTMYETVCMRFKKQGVPTFPMAGLLMFWGGVENGFWAFDHNPVEYAKSIKCPTLLLYGEKDEKVSRPEIDEIFANLQGKKELKLYPLAGHENYLKRYKLQWIADVSRFICLN